jgi:hypothetical protein
VTADPHAPHDATTSAAAPAQANLATAPPPTPTAGAPATDPGPTRGVSTHVCPGCRRAQVAWHLFACRPCWYRLPLEKRRAITDAYGRNPAAHRAAMTDAINWYASEAVR